MAREPVLVSFLGACQAIRRAGLSLEQMRVARAELWALPQDEAAVEQVIREFREDLAEVLLDLAAEAYLSGKRETARDLTPTETYDLEERVRSVLFELGIEHHPSPAMASQPKLEFVPSSPGLAAAD